MRCMMKIASAGLVLALLAGVARAEELKDIEKKIVEAGKDLKSMKADVNVDADMSRQGMTIQIRGRGTLEFMKAGAGDDEQTLSRMELEQKMSMKMGEAGGQEMESKMQMVTDKEFTYVLSEQGGQKQAFKRKPEKTSPGASSTAMFEELHKDFELSYKGEEKVDGVDAYVIEGKPKEANENVSKQVFYFDKEDGIMRKMVVHGPEGAAMQTMTITNIKRNVEIKPERFKFEAPEGVPVMDMTSMPGQ